MPVFALDSSRSVAKLLIFGDSLTAGYGLEKKDSFAEKLYKALENKGHLNSYNFWAGPQT